MVFIAAVTRYEVAGKLKLPVASSGRLFSDYGVTVLA